MRIRYSTPSLTLSEFKPARRTVRHTYGTFNISFPWLYFVSTSYLQTFRAPGNLWFFCRKTRIIKKPTSPDLYFFEFPNVGATGEVGDCGWSCEEDHHEKLIKSSINHFWFSSFSYGSTRYWAGMPVYHNNDIYQWGADILREWAGRTKEDIYYWKQYDFPKISHSFKFEKEYWV